jgi:2-amino-4-hydroxy-6-hydroxymethyldihydropteridine diphosphokinase
MKESSNLTNTAYISFGSNMGDRVNNCATGIELLEAECAVHVESVSDFYYTAPMELEDQAWFVNGAVKVSTSLPPLDLLALLKSIESKMGRRKTDVRFGPRVFDFDIIFYNDEIIDTPKLVIPHPRMHYREFVLRPMCDLSPGLIHPVLNKSIAQLIHGISDDCQQYIRIKTNAQRESISVLPNPNTADQEEIANEVLY